MQIIKVQKMMINCSNCQNDFTPSQKQTAFIETAIQKTMNLIMLECPNCGLNFGTSPTKGQTSEEIELPLRTPISGSHGFISCINEGEEYFYGCGESGAIWENEESLFEDIKKIVHHYPHRKNCYIRVNNAWVANPNEPDNIDELIDKEKKEVLNDFIQD